MVDKLRILSFGAGAIGGYIGGSLSLSGHQVIFLERSEVSKKLKATGFELQLPDGLHRIANPLLVDHLEQAFAFGPFDAALVAVKSYDTQALIDTLTPFHDQLPALVCLQNGVDNEPLLGSAFGNHQVIPATVTSSIGKPSPNTIAVERLRGVGIGAGHRLSESLVSAMCEAGLNARLYSNSSSMKWSKLLTNLPGNALSAILDMSPAEIFAHPGLYQLEINQLRECLKVMDAQSIPIVDLPGTPVRLLALGIRAPSGLSRKLLPRAIGGGRGAKMPSFHIDLYSGRQKSEVAYLNGAVVKYGEQFGIPTPVNRRLTRILLDLTSGQLPLDTYRRQPDKLLNHPVEER